MAARSTGPTKRPKERKGQLPDAVRDGVESGQIELAEPELKARLLYHGTHGVLHDAIASDAGLREKDVIRAVRELHIKVFSAPTSSAG